MHMIVKGVQQIILKIRGPGLALFGNGRAVSAIGAAALSSRELAHPPGERVLQPPQVLRVRGAVPAPRGASVWRRPQPPPAARPTLPPERRRRPPPAPVLLGRHFVVGTGEGAVAMPRWKVPPVVRPPPTVADSYMSNSDTHLNEKISNNNLQ